MKFIYATIVAAVLLLSGCGNENTQEIQEEQMQVLTPPAPPAQKIQTH